MALLAVQVYSNGQRQIPQVVVRCVSGCVKEVYEGDPEPLVLVVRTMAPQRYNIIETPTYGTRYLPYRYSTARYRTNMITHQPDRISESRPPPLHLGAELLRRIVIVSLHRVVLRSGPDLRCGKSTCTLLGGPPRPRLTTNGS